MDRVYELKRLRKELHGNEKEYHSLNLAVEQLKDSNRLLEGKLEGISAHLTVRLQVKARIEEARNAKAATDAVAKAKLDEEVDVLLSDQAKCFKELNTVHHSVAKQRKSINLDLSDRRQEIDAEIAAEMNRGRMLSDEVKFISKVIRGQKKELADLEDCFDEELMRKINTKLSKIQSDIRRLDVEHRNLQQTTRADHRIIQTAALKNRSMRAILQKHSIKVEL